MSDPVDAVEMKARSHLFEWLVPALYEKEVREFYYNLRLNDDGSLNLVVKAQSIHLDENILGTILNVSTKWNQLCHEDITLLRLYHKNCKGWQTQQIGVSERFMKGTFQLYFEFINKVLLPRFEKRTVAIASDLFLMESLRRMEDNISGR